MKQTGDVKSHVNDAQGKLLTFQVLNLELSMVQQTFNMLVHLKLGGIGLKQYQPSQTLNLVVTPMTTGNEEYLLSINYRQVFCYNIYFFVEVLINFYSR